MTLRLISCWPVTLESLDDRSAVIRLQPRWFRLYKQTSQLRQMIPESEFHEIFETVWSDRARAAGWALHIEYDRDDSVFRLKR